VCFVLGSKSGEDGDKVEVAASVLLPLTVGWLPWDCFMFEEEEGVVAGFCSGFCRACGLAWNDMAGGGEWERANALVR
jgi:hypothetical protein